MDDVFVQLLAFALSVALLIGFFILVSRVGQILRVMGNLEQQAAEQTRYLAAISANVAIALRASESQQSDGTS